MLTADLTELLHDVNLHMHKRVIVFEYQGNKVRVCSGGLTTRQVSDKVFLGTADTGYFIGNEHMVLKEVSLVEPRTVHYRVLHDDVEIINIDFA